MSKVLRKYALNHLGEIVSAEQVKAYGKDEQGYTCPHSGAPVIARVGNVNAPHFAIKPDYDCSYDTYLHTLAERVIEERFKNSEHFYVTMPFVEQCDGINTCPYKSDSFLIDTKCEFRHKPAKCDLKRYYDTIIVEKMDESSEDLEQKKKRRFIPDIKLVDSRGVKEDIWIEIWVTHECEKEKIDTGKKIIEIRFKRDTEIYELLDSGIEESKNVIFHNFKGRAKAETELGTSFARFDLYEEAGGFYYNLSRTTCTEAIGKPDPDVTLSLAYPVYGKSRQDEFELFCITESNLQYKAGINSCHLCKFGAAGQPNRCKLNCASFTDTEMSCECDHYRLDQERALWWRRELGSIFVNRNLYSEPVLKFKTPLGFELRTHIISLW